MNRVDFINKFPAIFQWLKRNGKISLLDNLVPKSNKSWTLETCTVEALKYSTLKEYRKHSTNSYVVAVKRKWLEKCCSHMELKIRWTLEKCKNSAAAYKHRFDWNKENAGAYHAAAKNGWIEECCSHMESNVGKHSMRQILCSNGVTYESASHAFKELGVSRSSIGGVLKGRQKHAKGFTFSYTETTKE